MCGYKRFMMLSKNHIGKLLIMLAFIAQPSFAVNEMEHVTDFEQNIENDKETIELNIQQDDIIDKIQAPKEDKLKVHKRLGEPTGSPMDLFRSSGYSFEKGPIKNQKFRYFLHGGVLLNAQTHEDLSGTTSVAANELHSETLFADGKTTLMIAYNLTKHLDDANRFFQKFSSLYISHRFNEHQTLEIGETRVPIGYEGGISSSAIKMFSRSQIARTFGNYYSTGIKNTGKYKYGDYVIGYFDASRSFRNNFQGQEFAFLGTLKPLGKFDGKYGNLQIGGSIDSGNSDNAFTVVGGHAIYDYKKFHADFEYLYANGMSGNHYGHGRAHGLYTTVGYFILPKVEVLARYDFMQNLDNDNVTQEYSTGLTYYFSPKVKLMLQYIYAMSDFSSNPSHKIYIGTDFSTSAILDLL